MCYVKISHVCQKKNITLKWKGENKYEEMDNSNGNGRKFHCKR